MERRTFLKSSGAGIVAQALGFTGLLSTGIATSASADTKRSTILSRAIQGGYPSGAKPLETASNDLTPYTGVWDDAHLRHLLRRSMFGVPQSQFNAAKALGSMSAVVAKLLEAKDLVKHPLPPKPAPYFDEYLVPAKGNMVDGNNKQRQDAERVLQLRDWWFDLMIQENLSIREKMTLLWTNHFVTGAQTVKAAGYVYTYLQTCRANALGNFRSFVSTISVDPAMLVYLNGNQNFVRSGRSFVNENYGRELMELFTLGIVDPVTNQPNYTETDIQNAARALTGWQPTTTAPFVGTLNAALHDSGAKTFMGQTGNWGLEDILNIIFAKGTPAGYNVAYFVSQKLYETFVYYIPNTSVVDAMARLMVASQFEIAPVMSALLSSDHFYDVNVMGAQPKSPAEYMASLVREFGLTYPAWSPTDPPVKSTDVNGNITYSDPNITLSVITETIMSTSQGQELLNPPNVKGWPGGHNWISTGTFQGRENTTYAILNNLYSQTKAGVNLTFDPTTYSNQIANAAGLTPEALSKALEDVSLALTLGPLEFGDLNTDLQGTYKEPNYQFNTVGVKAFANYLASLPEFQLL